MRGTISKQSNSYIMVRYDATIELNEKAETVSFTFEEAFPAGADLTLVTLFTGSHNDKLAGFYRSGYTDNEGNKK